jgi:flagellar basal-body rod protein FlgB
MSESPSMLQVLESYINVTNSRHSLVVNNMANVDTPGYHTQDIDFRRELTNALDGTNPMGTPVVHTVQGLLERPDGNNVSLDREGLALSETQLQFRIGVQLIRDQFHRLMTAINEGKQG